MIEYYKKNVSDYTRIYLVDKDKAKAIEVLTSLKTIREQDIEALTYLGLEFQEIPSPKTVE